MISQQDQRPYHIAQANVSKHRKEFEWQVDLGLLERIYNTKWGFLVLICPKSNEKICTVQDFRNLNKGIKLTHFLIPEIHNFSNDHKSTNFSPRWTSQCIPIHLSLTKNSKSDASLSRPFASSAELFYLRQSKGLIWSSRFSLLSYKLLYSVLSTDQSWFVLKLCDTKRFYDLEYTSS